MAILRALAAMLFCLALTGQEVEQARSEADLNRQLDAYRRVLLDWAGLTRYGSEDAEIQLKPADGRVVFLGDEITEQWGGGDQPFFPGKPYVNRGIARQTAAQMLVRFRQDVIDLNPAVVVIEAGTNDIAGVMGPSSEGMIANQFSSIVELAKLHRIRVVLASVTPVCDCFQNQTNRRKPARIIGLNGWLKGYAKSSGSIYLDYYSGLASGRAMRKELTADGFLPNAAGYGVMQALAEKSIKEALERP